MKFWSSYFNEYIFLAFWSSPLTKETELFVSLSDLVTLLSIWPPLYLWMIFWLSINLSIWSCMILSRALWRDSDFLDRRVCFYDSRTIRVHTKQILDQRRFLESSVSFLIAKIISRILKKNLVIQTKFLKGILTLWRSKVVP